MFVYPQIEENSTNLRLYGLQRRLSGGFLSFIYFISTILGIIGGLIVLFEIFRDDVIVHEVHLERRRTFLTDLFASKF